MIKISYNTLGAAVFILGLLLQVKWPGQVETMGHHLFQAYSIPVESENGVSFVWIISILIQASGVMLFMKWLSVEHPRFFKKYTRYEPVLLATLLLIVPYGFNSLLSTSAKTYVYAAENGVGAIEYIGGECTREEQNEDDLYECRIILKNYEHKSQQVTIHFPVTESLKGEKNISAYLQMHEQKEIKIQFSADEIADLDGVPEFTIQS